MLHKLALLTMENTPSLIKEALPTREEHMAALARDQQKALELAKLRGIEVPRKTQMVQHPDTGLLVSKSVPDLDNLRLNPRTEATTAIAEGIKPQTKFIGIDPKTGKALLEEAADAGVEFKKQHQIPGASTSAGHSALAEKELQKAYGDVAQSRAKQLRHTYLGGAKRLWGGKGLFGNKWGNRAAVLGGLGTLGLGVKAYMDSNKPLPTPVPQPEQSMQPWQEPTYMQYMQPQDYAYYKESSDKYSPDAVTIPKPTSQPTVKALGPGTPSITGMSGTNKSKGLLGRSSSGMGNSSGSSRSTTGKQAEDTGVLPLLGAAAGGAGGWVLGSKFLQPTLREQERVLAAEIAKKQNQLKMLKQTTGKAAIGSAAAGAILLAALTAYYAKRNKDKPKVVQPINGNYDPTGAGFQQHQYNPYGQFYG